MTLVKSTTWRLRVYLWVEQVPSVSAHHRAMKRQATVHIDTYTAPPCLHIADTDTNATILYLKCHDSLDISIILIFVMVAKHRAAERPGEEREK